MARTQAADYEQKRDLILRKAASLFAKRGFIAASVADLAAGCNVSKSLIYHYFPSKEAILFTVMDEHMKTLLSAIDFSNEAKLSPEKELKELSRVLLRKYVGAANQQKVLLYDLAFLPRTEQKQIVEQQRKIIEYVREILSRAAGPKNQNRDLLTTKVMLYFGMLNWTHSWFDAAGPISRDALADDAAATIIQSIEN